MRASEHGRDRSGTFVLLLMLLGAMLAVLADGRLLRPAREWALLVAALALPWVPAVARSIRRLLLSIDRLGPRGQWVAVASVVVMGVGYVLLQAHWQARSFLPAVHDEHVYLIQARMIASGRLWLPPHPLGDHLESFYLLTDGVYAGQYFLGQPLWLAIGLVVGAEPWMMSLLAAGVVCGLLTLLARDVTGRLSLGLLASLVLIGLPLFRQHALLLTAQMTTLMLTLAALLASLRLLSRSTTSETTAARWAAVLGVCLGWLAVTRPLDAVCVGVVVAATWLFRAPRPSRRGMRLALLVATGAAPFLVAQAVNNRGVTGSVWQSPFSLYAERFTPGVALGFQRPAAGIDSTLPQKVAFYEETVRPMLSERTPMSGLTQWTDGRASALVEALWPDPWLLLVIVPASFWLISSRGRVARRGRPVVWLIPVFCVAYSFYPYTLRAYFLTLAGSGAVLLAAAFAAARRLAPTWRWRATGAAVVLTLGTTLLSQPPLRRDVLDNPLGNLTSTSLAELERGIEGRAVLFVHYAPGHPSHDEVVYNSSVARPDDARVVRLQDLGPRNAESIAYYRAAQPDRRFYRLELATMRLFEIDPRDETDRAE